MKYTDEDPGLLRPGSQVSLTNSIEMHVKSKLKSRDEEVFIKSSDNSPKNHNSSVSLGKAVLVRKQSNNLSIIITGPENNLEFSHIAQ